MVSTYVDGLMQDRRNLIANALGFCISCINPPMCACAVSSAHYTYYGPGCSIWSTSQELCTVKPVCNDHLYNKIYYLWFIQ